MLGVRRKPLGRHVLERCDALWHGVIAVLGDNGEEALRIKFEGAWPCRWKLTTLDARRSDILIEEVELAVENLWVE